MPIDTDNENRTSTDDWIIDEDGNVFDSNGNPIDIDNIPIQNIPYPFVKTNFLSMIMDYYKEVKICGCCQGYKGGDFLQAFFLQKILPAP